MKRMIPVVFLLLAIADANARVWRVELDGSGDYTDIQPAVEAAAPGDTISIGPGRFDTFRSLPFPPWTVDAIVGVNKSGLTFSGSGSDRTFLGPSGKSDGMPQVFYSDGGRDAVIEKMTIENTDLSINWEDGRLLVQSCLFRSDIARSGGVIVDKTETIIRDCVFEMLTGPSAVSVRNIEGGLAGCLIDNCAIRGSRFAVDIGPWAENVVIRNTTIKDVEFGIQFAMRSRGRIENCAVAASWAFVVSVDSGAVAEIVNSTISGGLNGITVSGGKVTGTGNVISGATEATLHVNAGGLASIHGSHIIPASSGWSFFSSFYEGEPTSIDLTGNYWGTKDPEAIAASIRDHHTSSGLQCSVVYEPFADAPLPIERKSLGGVKAMFR